MFQFRRFPSHTYLIQCEIPCGGFPHSEISGSMLICSSPKLIAAYRVLHRLLMPRHSPCALSSLTSSNIVKQSPFRAPGLRLPPETPVFDMFSSQIQILRLWICKGTDSFESFLFKSNRSQILWEYSVNYIELSISVPMTVELCRLMFWKFLFAKL